MTKTLSRRLVPKFGGIAAYAIAVTALHSPAPAVAQQTIQMPEELCSYQPLTDNLIGRIRARSDLPQILDYLAANCPEVALLLAGPTASIPAGVVPGGNDGFNGPVGGGGGGGDDDNDDDDDDDDDDNDDNDDNDDDGGDGKPPKNKNNSGLGNNDEDGGVGCKDKTCYDDDNRGKNKVFKTAGGPKK